MNVKLAKLIVEKGYLSLDNLKTAVEEQKNTDKSLGIILIEHGFITEQQLLDITNHENEFEVVDIDTIEIQEKVIKLIPAENAKDNNLVPFELNGSFLSVAMLDPTNILLIDELRFLTGFNIKPYITLYSSIINALNKYYVTEADQNIEKGKNVDIDYDFESKEEVLSINDSEDKQADSDTKEELSVNEFSNIEQPYVPDSQVTQDQQNTVTEDTNTPNEPDTDQENSEVQESLNTETQENNNKVLDKIDIFNLSADEIEESRSYAAKKSNNSEDSSKQDLDLNEFQTPGVGKADTSPVPPKDTSVADINTANLFQAAPSDGTKHYNEPGGDTFQAPDARQTVKPDESQSLFMAPDISQKSKSTEDSKTEKEFGIPFTFKTEDELPKHEFETEQVEVTRQDTLQESHADPFRAFSGNNKGTSENLNTETTPPVSTDIKTDITESGYEDFVSVENADHVQTHEVVEPPADSNNNLDVFRSSVSSQPAKIEEKITVTQDEKEVRQTGNNEIDLPSTDPELESINVDTSYDNIESLNKDLQNQEPTPTPSEAKQESHETQTVQEQKVNITPHHGNGSSADFGTGNEKILQLEDDSLEQDEDIVRPTVLVVDDSPTVQKIVSVTLNRRGYNVEVSSNAMQALAKLNDCIPDIIFLDINLPHMDGYQLCKVIKSNELTKTIPVVMLSGKDGFFDKMRGKMVGATDYITKPFEPNTLVNAIEKQGITIARTN